MPAALWVEAGGLSRIATNSDSTNRADRFSYHLSQVSNFSIASKLTNPVFDLALGDAAASLSDERKANADPLAVEKIRERTALLRASLEQFEEASPERVRKIDLLLLTQGKPLIGYTHQKWTDQQNQRTLQVCGSATHFSVTNADRACPLRTSLPANVLLRISNCFLLR